LRWVELEERELHFKKDDGPKAKVPKDPLDAGGREEG